MMHADTWKTYESWRGLWLSGSDSNAIAALRFHGLRAALGLAGAAHARGCPPPSSSNGAELPITDVVIAEAASQVRQLLRVPWSPAVADITREHGENHCV